ncbi:MAG: ABC transporter permease, partial [Pyrinomonadaceae bacterium]
MRMVLKQYRRFFKRSPLVTLLASFVLAVGFAGSALAYTIMLAMSSPSPNGLRSIPYATIAEETGGGGLQSIRWKTYQHLRETARWSDPSLFAYAEPIQARLNYNQTDYSISVAAVSRGFFPGFTEGLDTGEDFSSSSESEQGGREVILSRRLAERLFSIPGEALDRQIELNNQTFRVIGVAPRNFSGLWSATDAWVTPNKIVSLEFGAFLAAPHAEPNSDGEALPPISNNPEEWQNLPIFYALAGSSNFSLERLRNELGGLVRSPDNLPYHLHVADGLSKDPIWDMKIRFWARLAFLLSVSLIFAAGLNYSGLLLAQAPRYIEEVRLKRVLGASALRILLENMCGPVLTVLVGFLVATLGTTAAIRVLGKPEQNLLPLGRIPLDTSFAILGIELAIAFFLAIVIALVPSIRLLWDSGAPRMGYTTTTSRKANFALSAIVAGQMASCILICLVAGMIIREVYYVSKIVPGFDSNHLIAVEMGAASKGAHITFSTAGDGEFPLATFTRQVLESSNEKLRDVQYTSAASCAP